MAATYDGKLITDERDGSLCFLTCPQGTDDFLIENNLSVAAAIDGGYLTYEPIEQQVKTLVLDDGSSITDEDYISVTSIPSNAKFVIVSEPAYYWQKHVVFKKVQYKTNEYVATFNDQAIYTTIGSNLNVIGGVGAIIEQLIEEGKTFADVDDRSYAASDLAYIDGTPLSADNMIERSRVPSRSKLAMVDEYGFTLNI